MARGEIRSSTAPPQIRRDSAHNLGCNHPRLKTRTVSPHSIRHTTALHLLQSGVDITVIALWLGHESPSTTHMYIEADLSMKERALQRLQPAGVKSTHYKPPDQLMQFLAAL
jgi:integrase/recombinase XerD